MPDRLMRKVKITAAERKTTFRALVIDALERILDGAPQRFELEDASVGSLHEEETPVSNIAINELIDSQRAQHFNP